MSTPQFTILRAHCPCPEEDPYYGYVHTILHGVAIQKTKISIFTAMRTSSLFLHMSMNNMSVK
jgi:hypothetical protein